MQIFYANNLLNPKVFTQNIFFIGNGRNAKNVNNIEGNVLDTISSRDIIFAPRMVIMNFLHLGNAEEEVISDHEADEQIMLL